MPPVPKVPTPAAAPAPAPSTAPATTPAKASTKSKSKQQIGPTEPPANRGAAVGRQLDNAGRRAGRFAAKTGKDAAAPLVTRGQRAAISGGSIVVGLVAYAIGVAYLQHGWPGVTGWLKAKLFNETSQGSAVVPAMLFHTGPGAGGTTAGTQVTATPPAAPAAPTPSGGILYA